MDIKERPTFNIEHPIMNERQREYPISNTQHPMSKEGQKERPTSNVQRPIMNERHCRGQVRVSLCY